MDLLTKCGLMLLNSIYLDADRWAHIGIATLKICIIF